MSEVKWIKLTTNMFDDEKIKLIEQMPDADTILVIWVKLLTQAGKTNASGYIYLSENIPYTDEMLSAIFNRPLSTVRMALSVFKQFGMLEIDEQSFISVANWEKHQNVDGLDKIREQTRKRVAEHREKKELNAPKKNVTLQSVTSNVTVTDGNATDIELELEEDKKDIVPFAEIVNYLNDVASKRYKTTENTKSHIRARWNEGHRLDDFKRVIDTKCKEWENDDMQKYIRPQTLFGTKFESYLNQKPFKKEVVTTYQDLGGREY